MKNFLYSAVLVSILSSASYSRAANIYNIHEDHYAVHGPVNPFPDNQLVFNENIENLILHNNLNNQNNLNNNIPIHEVILNINNVIHGNNIENDDQI